MQVVPKKAEGPAIIRECRDNFHPMKTILALFLATATLASAQNGEPIIFTAHLSGSSGYTGEGMFSLTGNSFSYRVRSPFGFSLAAIHGPALLGTDRPPIFSLPLAGCLAPAEDREGYCDFSTRPPFIPALSLSEQQITDLQAGLWYVTATSASTLRGQILQVPEPSVFSIMLAVGASVIGLEHALTRAEQRRTVQAVHKKAEGLEVVREC